IPNVKPATTDVILFAGFVLGAAPGFATGAITALVSNFFISQGSWTPWQMAAWGLVGILGAVLARVAGRDLGRWPPAVACALAGGPRALVPRARAELGRRVWCVAARLVEPDVHGLGRARDRRRRAQPGRRPARRAFRHRLHARARGGDQRRGGDRAHHPAAARGRRITTPLRRSRPRRGADRSPPVERFVRGQRELDFVRDPGPSRRG